VTTGDDRCRDALGDTDVVVLEHDRYYRDHPELRLEERALLNYDHPNSLDTDLLVSHLRELRAGRAVEIPVYDFSLHARRSETTPIKPGSAIIVEGILIFTAAPCRRSSIST
jgi:uridine kinase